MRHGLRNFARGLEATDATGEDGVMTKQPARPDNTSRFVCSRPGET